MPTRHSVSMSNCKAHELDNLYVVDSSFFVSIGAVNPTLTIIANALRVETTCWTAWPERPGHSMPATRTEVSVVYLAGMVQGIALVTFPAAGTIFTSSGSLRSVEHTIREHVPPAGGHRHLSVSAGRGPRQALQPQAGVPRRARRRSGLDGPAHHQRVSGP